MPQKEKKFFELMDYRVIVQKERDWGEPAAEAEVGIKVGANKERNTASGVGPVDALNNALRKSLEKVYPRLKKMKLTDYKVRVLPSKDGTAAKVRVFIESSDGKDRWETVGVSLNIIEASWMALVESFNYKLKKDERSC
jgi:2-isopropylmalate synthase